MLRLNKLSAVTMAITVALAACTDGTGLNDEPFDPNASAADLQVVQGAFSASVFESLAISSESFNLVADTGAVPAVLQASLAAASAGNRWEAAAAAEAFAAAGPASGRCFRTSSSVVRTTVMSTAIGTIPSAQTLRWIECALFYTGSIWSPVNP